MKSDAASIARRLAENAEAVCREYLSQGRRCGGYWLVGDVHGTPGRSLFVRLAGRPGGPGAPGKWRDAATGEGGDLLDLIALHRGHSRLRDTLEEARSFLSEPSRFELFLSPTAAAEHQGRRPQAPCRLAAPSGHPCGNLPAFARHHRPAALPGAAVPPRLLLPSRGKRSA